MRKFVKREVLEVLGTLQQATEKISEIGNTAQLQNFLAECQETAIGVGNIIEETEGEETDAVNELVKYCELLYQVLTGTVSDTDELKHALVRAAEGVKKLPEKKEVVFLPYKASMWDSLESVWKAADADPECDAYVIPIPYFDKNPDGSFKEEHYEGDLYPEYVPVTHYNDYDFKKRRPDAIYIHNPYDEFNYVTSVHPFFYSKNLKQYTDELVYIPYFVLNEIDPENEEMVEKMAHFVTVPGVVHADKVIVQSEAMRKAYVKVLVQHTGEEKREYWEEKILGLGSPKLDKVANTKREDIEVPAEWLKIIKKKDGSWKKIILYNTSVNAMLKHEEQMLAKIKNVLKVLQENSDEIALLWRPHPLMKATLESLRPDLCESYNKIVERYKSENWGIYDETAELDRAIAICDAYYGDPSSVVQLCKRADKVIMIQNSDILVK